MRHLVFLTARSDDGIVSDSEQEGDEMLMKTAAAFRDRTVYMRLENGRWKAEFHGAVHVEVEGPSLERCRFDALDALDQQLCDWIVKKRARSAHEESPE